MPPIVDTVELDNAPIEGPKLVHVRDAHRAPVEVGVSSVGVRSSQNRGSITGVHEIHAVGPIIDDGR